MSCSGSVQPGYSEGKGVPYLAQIRRVGTWGDMHFVCEGGDRKQNSYWTGKFSSELRKLEVDKEKKEENRKKKTRDRTPSILLSPTGSKGRRADLWSRSGIKRKRREGTEKGREEKKGQGSPTGKPGDRRVEEEGTQGRQSDRVGRAI